MAREVAFRVPTHPGQFGPLQIRPRTLLGLSADALARWFAAYLVPYPRLLTEHGTAFVFTTVRLDCDDPQLRLADADWLTVTARVTASDSAKYLRLSTRIAALAPPDRSQPRSVAAFRADLRVVTVVEDQTLTAIPGTLPPDLFSRFKPEEIYEPDRAALARDATPPGGKELCGAAWEPTLFRSHCEVADQWSFIEIMELLTNARERMYLQDAMDHEAMGTAASPATKLAVARPITATTAVFHRALYLFDTCRITTRLLVPDHIEGRTDGAPDSPFFLHTLDDPAHPGPCLTAWERTTRLG